MSKHVISCFLIYNAAGHFEPRAKAHTAVSCNDNLSAYVWLGCVWFAVAAPNWFQLASFFGLRADLV
jgi:hypothetical protein